MRDDHPTIKQLCVERLVFSAEATTTGPSSGRQCYCAPGDKSFPKLGVRPKSNLFGLPTISTIMPHPCADCGRSYVNKSFLTRHQRRHGVPNTMLECDVCHKKYDDGNRLNVHREAEHTGKPVGECPTCRKPR